MYEEVVMHKNGNKDNLYYFEEILDAKTLAEELLSKPLSSQYPDGYLFVTMGAGDNWKLGKAILENN